MTEHTASATAQGAFAEHEHRELARGVDRIGEVARLAGKITTRDLAVAVNGVLQWFDAVLWPHVAWENTNLYENIDRRAGTRWATRLMRFEHQQLQSAARHLAASRELLRARPSAEQLCEVRGQLFAIEAMLRSHMAREDIFLLPVLEGAEEEAVPVR